MAVAEKFPALLNEHDAIRHLRDVVAEFGPDHRYELPHGFDVCSYVHEDSNGENKTPGCIAGQVFHRHGVPLNVLEKYEGMDAGQIGGYDQLNRNELRRRGLEPLATEAAGKVLLAAQNVQDTYSISYGTWGAALAWAEAKYVEVTA